MTCHIAIPVLPSVVKGGAMPKREVQDTKLIARVPKALHERVKIECVRRGVTIQSAVEAGLKSWLKSKPQGKE